MKTKYKKLIIVFSIFFLSFLLFTEYKQKETQAVFVVDDITYIIIGLTVLATGIVAVNQDQVKDMGKMVVAELEENSKLSTEASVYLEDLRKEGSVIVNDTLINAIKSVAENLPNRDIIDTSYSSNEGWDLTSMTSIPMTLPFLKKDVMNLLVTGVVAGLPSSGTGFSVDFGGKSNYGMTVFNGYRIEIYNEASYRDNQMYVMAYAYNELGQFINRTSYISNWTNPTANLSYTDCLIDVKVSDKNFTTIPYSNSKIKELYNPTVINERFDNLIKNGTVTMDRDKVIGSNVVDRVITQEDVLTWDMVKDFVVTKDGTVTENPDVTVPGETTGTIDKVVDNVFDSTTTKSLDFSPLQLSLADRFPFCIPFDLIRVFGIFNASSQTPKFTVTMPENLVGGGSSFDIDFARFDKFASILRFFELLFFIVALIKGTRNLISH